jgi:hypothetical protein
MVHPLGRPDPRRSTGRRSPPRSGSSKPPAAGVREVRGTRTTTWPIGICRSCQDWRCAVADRQREAGRVSTTTAGMLRIDDDRAGFPIEVHRTLRCCPPQAGGFRSLGHCRPRWPRPGQRHHRRPHRRHAHGRPRWRDQQFVSLRQLIRHCCDPVAFAGRVTARKSCMLEW